MADKAWEVYQAYLINDATRTKYYDILPEFFGPIRLSFDEDFSGKTGRTQVFWHFCLR